MTDKDSCNLGQCVWSTGKEFIPDGDWCSHDKFSLDATVYSVCYGISSYGKTTCEDAPGCMWNTAGQYDKPKSVWYECKQMQMPGRRLDQRPLSLTTTDAQSTASGAALAQGQASTSNCDS